MRCAQHFCTHKRDGSLRSRAYPDDLTAQHSLDVAARFMMAIKDQYPFPGVAHSEWVRHSHRRAARRLRACWCNRMHACSEQSLWHPARARARARRRTASSRRCTRCCRRSMSSSGRARARSLRRAPLFQQGSWGRRVLPVQSYASFMV